MTGGLPQPWPQSSARPPGPIRGGGVRGGPNVDQDHEASPSLNGDLPTCPPGSSPAAPPASAVPSPTPSSTPATTPSSPPATRRRSQDLAEAHPDTALALALDVTDHDAGRRRGRRSSRDGSAPSTYWSTTPATATAQPSRRATTDDVGELFATNVFGAVVMIKAVLPGMRAARNGDDREHLLDRRPDRPAPAPATTPPRRPPSKAFPRRCARRSSRSASPSSWSSPARSVPTSPADRCSSRPRLRSPTTPTPPASAARRHDTVHGTQPGDPDKAAQAIITAVTSTTPPSFLLLGNDALGIVRGILDERRAEIDTWQHLSASTDIGS